MWTLRFAAKHAVAGMIVVAGIVAFTAATYFALLLWAMLTGQELGGPLALPFMVLFAFVAGVVSVAVILLPQNDARANHVRPGARTRPLARTLGGRNMLARSFILLVAVLAQAGADTGRGNGEFPRFRYMLPQGFRGWACIDFGVQDAPPLKEDAQGIYQIEPISDAIVTTSSLPNLKHGPFPSELMERVDGQPRRIEFREIQDRFEYSTTSTVSRSCLLFGSAAEAGAFPRPPTLRESQLGTSPVLREFEFQDGSLCDFRHVSRVCVDARDVRRRNIGRTIVSAVGLPGSSTSQCDRFDGVTVRYRAEWSVNTHSSARGAPTATAEVRREQRGKGTVAAAIWIDNTGASADASGKRFGHDLAELLRQASTTTCVK
jgi:hypothetical protein